MAIKNRFSDNLVSSTKLNAQLVAGLADSSTGPVQLPVTLKNVAESVSVNLPRADSNASHARPSMFANISSFAQNVSKAISSVAPGLPVTEFHSLDEMAKRDFTEWQGLMAAVALHHVYSGTGLKLTVQPLHLMAVDSAGKVNVLHRCILMEMDKDRCYKDAITKRDILDNPLEGFLYYICQNGVPFAIFHPEVGLAAMKEYNAAIFENVLPWYKSGEPDCHKAWLPIMPIDGKTMLDDFCLSRIAWWAGQNDMLPYQNFITSKLKNPEHVIAGAPGAPISNATDIDNIPLWQGKGVKFGTARMFYTDPAGRSYELPELYLDNLLLTGVGDQSQNKLIYNTSDNRRLPLKFTPDSQVLEGFAPVAPLRRGFVDLLEHCAVDDMTFEARMAGTQILDVKMSITIHTNAGEVFTTHKTYGADKLRCGSVPYMMIWPWIPLPRNQKLWKNFYATWQDQGRGLSILRNSQGKDLEKVTDLTFDFEAQGTANSVLRATAARRDAWKVCTGAEPFRYALLKGKFDPKADDLEEIGLIFLPGYETYNAANADVTPVNNNPVKLAVDFGTTSTVCALRHSMHKNNAIVNLPFQDYSFTVTCDDAAAKEVMDVEHWLGNTADGEDWPWNRKIFSVAQLFDRPDGGGISRANPGDSAKQHYYVDGRMFLVSGSALSNYAGAIKGGADPLRTQMIMNDMKFAKELDVLNYQAASVYLAGIYMYAVLYLLSEKIIPGMGDYIELRASYPNPVTLNALTTTWTYAKSILDKVIEPSLTAPISNLIGKDQFYNEATATTAYYRSPETPPAQRLTHIPALVSLDIGGGTTDISITHINYPDKMPSLSLRYAGREIMVSSLIESFRRFSSGAAINADAFDRIWEKDEPTLLRQFKDLCGTENPISPLRESLQGLTANSSVRMNVEMLLSRGMRLPRSNVDMDTRLLRQLITLKFFMMLKVVARFVRENIDLWRNPVNNELIVTADKLDVTMSVSGTSAQMLKYIFDCETMAALALLRNPTLADPKMHACRELMNIMFTEELKDVLGENQSVNIKIVIDVDVSEKVQVCHGMLMNNITAMSVAAKNTAAAAAMENIRETILGDIEDDDLREQARKQKEQDMERTLVNYDMNFLKAYLDGTEENRGLLYYIRAYEKIFFGDGLKMNCGLGDVQAISGLLKNYNNPSSFIESRMAVADKRARYMVEDEQDKYTDLLSCMYLVDEIIDWEMASRQCM